MIIKEVRVKNFRCLSECTLSCHRLTALVGRNGSGKSALLAALRMFYDPAAEYDEEDFHGGLTAAPIQVAITFNQLAQGEEELFSAYLQGGELTVEKEMTWPRSKISQKYFGARLRNPQFQEFRRASGTELRRAYSALREQSKYSSLPLYENRDQGERALADWEGKNPGECERRRDDGQFFGFREVGESHLERYTKFVLIPAVRDALEEAGEGKGAAVGALMDMVVRSALARREDLGVLKNEMQERYDAIVDPQSLPELKALEGELSAKLNRYAPGGAVDLRWEKAEGIELPMPQADVRLVEDEYPSKVGRTGHGLQRAFILAVLEHLALAAAPVGAEEARGQDEKVSLPSLIISMEEPELYQHPNRQRHLARILRELAHGEIAGAAESIQVLYSTHSPLFVDISHFDDVRMLRKEQAAGGGPKYTRVVCSTLDEVACELGRAHSAPEGKWTADSLKPRLQTLMTPWVKEGFFADVAVLVEGEEDRAAVMAVGEVLGKNLESLGISVIPCGGKTCLDRPLVIFRQLGIRTYVLWDNDRGKKDAKPEPNRALLRLHNREPEDWPSGVFEEFACFEGELQDTLRSELGGELFESILSECKEGFQIPRNDDAVKNPRVMQALISRARDEGKESASLNEVVQRVCNLRDLS